MKQRRRIYLRCHGPILLRAKPLRASSQVRESHATVLIHARKASITADLGLWGIHTI